MFPKVIFSFELHRYNPKFVKEYVEESKPVFSVGEYWDSCNYVAPDSRLDYNQGIILQKYISF